MRQAIVGVVVALLGMGASMAGEDPVVVESAPRWFKGNLHTHSL